jgi:hypothetical protein
MRSRRERHGLRERRENFNTKKFLIGRRLIKRVPRKILYKKKNNKGWRYFLDYAVKH